MSLLLISVAVLLVFLACSFKRTSMSICSPLALLISFAVMVTTGCSGTESPEPRQTVNLGALLDMNAENGLATKAAIELAIEDLNRYAITAGRTVSFTCSYADTRMDAAEAQNQLKGMYQQGISMFVGGPYSSSELQAIAPFVNQNSIALINTNSTAIGLNHAGSHIYRIITDDSFQAKALVRAVTTRGVKAIIPIVRDDVWGNSLLQSFTARFVSEGGIVYPGAVYDPSENSFTNQVNTVNTQVNEAIAAYGAANVAVMAFTFNEITGIMTKASTFQLLGSVKWYGCDGNSQLKEMITDPIIAGFAVKTEFMAPMMAIGWTLYTPPFTTQLSSKIVAQTGITPDIYALSAYDATFVMGLAYLQVGSADMDKINAMIPLISSTYDQMGISRQLNANNDLLQANYIFWNILQNPNGYYWGGYGTYWYDIDVFA